MASLTPLFGRPGPTAPSQEARIRIQAWTRRRFKLDEDAAVMVVEMACTRPDCPPLETIVAFWDEETNRHQFRLLRPMSEVTAADIGWLIGSLTDHEGAWDCC